MRSRLQGLGLVLIAIIVLGVAPPSLAQVSQLSSEASLQAPDDTTGVAPQAKIVASWPRVAKTTAKSPAETRELILRQASRPHADRPARRPSRTAS